ncbi:MAG: disulfide bond formation protein B [Alphaproteobacteria bacterium]|nr:MAG: disulfide bond formation protein B [Alphaproteobacteria bacterium]
MSVLRRLIRDPASYLLIAAALIIAVLVMQYGFGYVPCELCYWQRYPYYALLAVGLAYLGQRLVGRTTAGMDRAMLTLAGVAFLASGGIGLYHAGVEWHWWPGPGRCSGLGELPDDPDALMAMLGKVRIVPCDEPAVTILGLSLAAWNAVIGVSVGVTALFVAFRAGRKGKGHHG